MKLTQRFGFLVALLAMSTVANAALTFDTDETSFVASLAAPISDDFSAYATPGGPDVPIPVAAGPTAFGPLILTAIGSEAGLGELEIRAAGTADPASDNSLFGFLDGSPDAFSFKIEFAAGAVNSFGATYLSAASLGGSIVKLDNGDSFVMADELPPPATGFLGFSSDSPFSSVEFTLEDKTSFEGVFIEDVVFDPVPEPTACFLLISAAVLLLRRR